MPKIEACFYATTADFKGVTVKIFFCRPGKNGIWHSMLNSKYI
jgi:hypothetical protein